MTVQELILELQQFPPEMIVKLEYPSGDYWRTVLAKDISDVDVGNVEYSSYHQTDKVVDEDEDETRILLLK